MRLASSAPYTAALFAVVLRSNLLSSTFHAAAASPRGTCTSSSASDVVAIESTSTLNTFFSRLLRAATASLLSPPLELAAVPPCVFASLSGITTSISPCMSSHASNLLFQMGKFVPSNFS